MAIPHDGRTLHAQLEQTTILLQDLPGSLKPQTAIVDLGYRGVDADVAPIQVIHRGKHKSLDRRGRRLLKRKRLAMAFEILVDKLNGRKGLTNGKRQACKRQSSTVAVGVDVGRERC